jgi:hypothetical protein
MQGTTSLDTTVREYSIYALIDPRTDEVRYIGKAKDPARRLRDHLQPSQISRHRSHKNSWLKGLLAAGHEPQLLILDSEITAEDVDNAERLWISLYRVWDATLTNGTDGGDGGAMSSEIAKAAGLKRRGRIRGVEEAENSRRALRAHWDINHPEAAERRARRSKVVRSLGLIPPVHIGENNPQARFTEADVLTIREAHAAGTTRRKLAEDYATSVSQVSYIVTGQAWAHVGGPLVTRKTKQRLSDEEVARIRELVESGTKQSVVARLFGIHQSHVSKIVSKARRVLLDQEG